MAMIPTSEVAPPAPQNPVGNYSQAPGAFGQGLQIGASLYRGYSAVQAAETTERSAALMGTAERKQIYSKYAQAFDTMAEEQRRTSGTRMVAAASTGVAMEGSVMEVFKEAKRMADKQRSRAVDAMRSEIAASIAKERQIRKAAEDKKKYARINTALTVGAIGAGLL